MIVGVPKEIKVHEYRVSLTPKCVAALTAHGIEVLVEKSAGVGSGYEDEEYAEAGARIVSKKEVFLESNILVKVKEPQECEYHMIQPGQVVFTFFHFAGCLGLEQAMNERSAICIPYETVELPNKTLPILAPMSEVAGRLAVQEGMRLLTSNNGGQGVLLAGVPGVEALKVVVIGAGIVGLNAAQLAANIGAEVYLMDNNLARLRELSVVLPKNVKTVFSTPAQLTHYLSIADLAIGAVLIPGKEAPKIVTKDMLSGMKKGSIFIDVAIDQGGMTEVSTPTTHDAPTFKYKNVTMYCVANMPGIVPRTSTQALSNATFPYVMALAKKGWKQACYEYPELQRACQKYYNMRCGIYVHSS